MPCDRRYRRRYRRRPARRHEGARDRAQRPARRSGSGGPGARLDRGNRSRRYSEPPFFLILSLPYTRERPDAGGSCARLDGMAGGTEFIVGTASWTDPSLVKSDLFYPPSLKTAEQRLRFYAEQFKTVE